MVVMGVRTSLPGFGTLWEGGEEKGGGREVSLSFVSFAR